MTGYPEADYAVHSHLDIRALKGVAIEYCHLTFLTKLFAVAAEYMRKMAPEKTFADEAELALHWRDHLEANDRAVRNELYRRVIEVCDAPLFDDVHTHILRVSRPTMPLRT